MSLQPLLNAAPAIQVHAFAAMAAFALGIVQLSAPKGTLPHRTLGYIWVVLMVVVAGTSFWIHDIRMWGPWSAIHLLSIFTLCDAADRGGACAAPPRDRAPQRHDLDVRWRAVDRRSVHLPAGPDHARGCLRQLT